MPTTLFFLITTTIFIEMYSIVVFGCTALNPESKTNRILATEPPSPFSHKFIQLCLFQVSIGFSSWNGEVDLPKNLSALEYTSMYFHFKYEASIVLFCVVFI